MALSRRDMQGQTLVVRQERCRLLRRDSGHGRRERQFCRLELTLGEAELMCWSQTSVVVREQRREMAQSS